MYCVYIYTICRDFFIKDEMERFSSFRPAGGARIRDSSCVGFFFLSFLFTHSHVFLTLMNPHWTRFVDQSGVKSLVGGQRVNTSDDSQKNQLKCVKVKSLWVITESVCAWFQDSVGDGWDNKSTLLRNQ